MYERCRGSAFWEVQCFGVQCFDPALLRNCVLPDGGPMCSDEFSFVNHLFSVEPSQLYMSKCRTIVGVQQNTFKTLQVDRNAISQIFRAKPNFSIK